MSSRKRFKIRVLDSSDFSLFEEMAICWSTCNLYTYLLHRSMEVYQKNKRPNISKSKTRSEVRGGGKKPWKQKGTGRARAGSNRSPLWRGGGTIFGPTAEKKKPLKLNKREKLLAIKTILYKNLDNIIVFNDLSCFVDLKKTKDFANQINFILEKNSKESKSPTLILADTPDCYLMLKRVSKNLKNIRLVQQDNVNIPLLLFPNQNIILTKSYIEQLRLFYVDSTDCYL